MAKEAGGDRELAALARNGDSDAFEQLFERFYDAIYALAYRLCGRRDDAEDIAQETFMRMARSIEGFRGAAQFKTWLFRIAVNVATDWRKRTHRLRRATEEYARQIDTKANRAPERNCREDEGSGRVLGALESLPHKQRQAVVLTIYEGMAHAQAAEILGCAETTVSWRVFRAKKMLRNLLSKSPEGLQG